MCYSGDLCATNFSLLLDSINNWSIKWQLPMSVNKCGWMLISNRIYSRELNFNLAGHSLTKLSEVKDLGVLYTSELSFAPHISSIISKAKQRSFLIRKSFTSSSIDALVLAFKTYVLPILDYCSPVWSPYQVSDILRIESVQRTFTRSMPCCKDLSYRDRLKICGLVTLERRRLIADLILFYKIIHRLIETDLTDSLTLSTSAITRGHPFKLAYNGARINSRLHFFSLRTTKVWNTLPAAVVCAQSVDGFRKGILLADFSEFLML